MHDGIGRAACALENGISVASDSSKELQARQVEAPSTRARRQTREEKKTRATGWLGPWMEWIQLSLRVSWLLGVWLSAKESLVRDGYLFHLGRPPCLCTECFKTRGPNCKTRLKRLRKCIPRLTRYKVT